MQSTPFAPMQNVHSPAIVAPTLRYLQIIQTQLGHQAVTVAACSFCWPDGWDMVVKSTHVDCALALLHFQHQGRPEHTYASDAQPLLEYLPCLMALVSQ